MYAGISPSRSILHLPGPWEFDLCTRQYQDFFAACLPVRFNQWEENKTKLKTQQEFGYKTGQKAFCLPCFSQQCIACSSHPIGPHLTCLVTPTQVQLSLGSSRTVPSFCSLNPNSHKGCWSFIHFMLPTTHLRLLILNISFEISVNSLFFDYCKKFPIFFLRVVSTMF